MSQTCYEVKQLKKPVNIDIEVPGSKSITNRALLLAALAKGTSTLSGVLFSDDSRHFMGCLQALGFGLSIDEDSKTVTIQGEGGKFPSQSASLHCGSAGTAARFITAMLALSQGEYTIDASEQMKARPMKPLFDALTSLGASVTYQEREGYLPCTMRGGRLAGGSITIDATISSQFVSALMMTGCFYRDGLTIYYQGGRASLPYVDITAAMMAQFGCPVTKGEGFYEITSKQRYTAQNYPIEPDVSSACYFYAMATLTGGKARVRGVHANSLQGDIRFLEVLQQLGCSLEHTPEGILLCGPENGVFPGITVDMNSFSDQTMTLAALAPFAQSPTTIKNIGHIRYQESDRIHAIATELTRMGIRCVEREDALTIYPGTPKPCEVETYNDHRMAMAFSLIGLKAGGIGILNPACTFKTFENYFTVLDSMIQSQM